MASTPVSAAHSGATAKNSDDRACERVVEVGSELVASARERDAGELRDLREHGPDMRLDQPLHAFVVGSPRVDHEVEQLRVQRREAHVGNDRRVRRGPRHRAAGGSAVHREVAAEFAEDLVGGGSPQVVLRREVVGHESLGDAGARRNVACARRLEALFGESRYRGADDAGAGFFALLGASRHACSLLVT